MSAEVRSPSSPLEAVQRIGIGLAFILFPLIFIYAFAAHPGKCRASRGYAVGRLQAK